MDRTEHWDRIYERRSPREVSWYERTPTISIRRVPEADGGHGPSSTLAPGPQCSSTKPWSWVSAASRSWTSPCVHSTPSAERLGSKADRIEWIVGDVTAIEDVGMFDIWHDRAVFHFLTDAFDQERYVSL